MNTSWYRRRHAFVGGGSGKWISSAFFINEQKRVGNLQSGRPAARLRLPLCWGILRPRGVLFHDRLGTSIYCHSLTISFVLHKEISLRSLLETRVPFIKERHLLPAISGLVGRSLYPVITVIWLPANRFSGQRGPADEDRISLRLGGVVGYPTFAHVICPFVS